VIGNFKKSKQPSRLCLFDISLFKVFMLISQLLYYFAYF